MASMRALPLGSLGRSSAGRSAHQIPAVLVAQRPPARSTRATHFICVASHTKPRARATPGQPARISAAKRAGVEGFARHEHPRLRAPDPLDLLPTDGGAGLARRPARARASSLPCRRRRAKKSPPRGARACPRRPWPSPRAQADTRPRRAPAPAPSDGARRRGTPRRRIGWARHGPFRARARRRARFRPRTRPGPPRTPPPRQGPSSGGGASPAQAQSSWGLIIASWRRGASHAKTHPTTPTPARARARATCSGSAQGPRTNNARPTPSARHRETCAWRAPP
jgi:hypothetical protein